MHDENSYLDQPNCRRNGSPRVLCAAPMADVRNRLLATLLLAVPLIAGAGCGSLGARTSVFSKLFRSPADSNHLIAAKPSVAATEAESDQPFTVSIRDDSPVLKDAPEVTTVGYEEVCRVDPNATGYQAATLESQCFQENCGGCQTGCAACGCQLNGPMGMNVQEYIFDGGDQLPSVEIKKDWSTAGVNPTDTVMYYETLAGTVCVRPTNRVAIYAPRFGAVRQLTGALLSSGAIGTERVLAPIAPGRFDETNLAGTVVQPLAPQGEQQVRLIDAFQENNGGVPIAQVLPPQRMSEARVPFEGVEVIGVGKITDDEIAVLGRVLQNARAWSIPESLDIMIDGKPAAMIRETAAAQDLLVYETPDKCAMRICKTASHTIANSGDIVSFTIRFDNAGTKPLGNVVMVDSLSPRLEYIEDSQQCSIETRFTAEPNDVGSQVLRWEIVSPVKASDGGAISFDCRVR